MQGKAVHMRAWMYLKTIVFSGSEKEFPRVGPPREGKLLTPALQ